MSTLGDILNDEPSNEPIEPVEVEAQEPAAPARDEQGRFAPKGETESASPAPVEEPQPNLDHPALIAERRRRQEAEARIAAYEAAQAQQPAPSVWEDEQGWQEHMSQQLTAQAVQAATLNARLDMSEMLARQANPDFDEMKEVFIGLMQENPALRNQCQADPHPWNKAYQIAKNYKAMQDLGATDLSSLEAKLTEKIRAELAAQQPQAPAAPQSPFPQSLANAQSARTQAVQSSGPPSLADILRG